MLSSTNLPLDQPTCPSVLYFCLSYPEYLRPGQLLSPGSSYVSQWPIFIGSVYWCWPMSDWSEVRWTRRPDISLYLTVPIADLSCQNGGCCPLPACPTGQLPAQECGVGGICPTGFACQLGGCCPVPMCPNGQVAIQSCGVNGMCPSGKTTNGMANDKMRLSLTLSYCFQDFLVREVPAAHSPAPFAPTERRQFNSVSVPLVPMVTVV